MPQVPYSSQPSIRVEPLPGRGINPNAPREAFGGGVASQGLPDLSGVANAATGEMQERHRIRLEETAKANQIATTHAYGALTVGVNDILHGPDGLLNRQGKDAFTIDQEAYDRFGKLEADIRSQLGNDDQRAVFDKAVINEYSQLDSQVQPHIARQRKVFAAQGTDALVTAKRNEALLSPDNPAIVENSIAIQQAAIGDNLRLNGAPDEEIAVAKAQAASSTRLGVLETMLNSDRDLTAAAYFDKHRTEFVGKDLQQAERLTAAGSIRGASQRQADAIVLTTHSLTDAVNQAHAITDPRIRDETEQRIRRHFADQASDLRQEREQAFQQASGILEQTGNFDKIPLSVRTKLTPEENGALQRREDQIRHPKTQTDWDTYNSLMNMSAISDVTREQFKDTDLTKYRGKLADSEFKQLLGIQRTLRGHDITVDEREAAKKKAQADKDAKKVAEREAAKQTLRDLGVAIPPTVPGAPLPKPATAAPANPAPAPRSSSGQSVPQAWLDHAKSDPVYKDYLERHGFIVPQAPVIQSAPPPVQLSPAKPKGVSIVRDSAGRATALVPQ